MYTYEDGHWLCVDMKSGDVVRFASAILKQSPVRKDNIIYYIDLSPDKREIALRYNTDTGETEEILKNRDNKREIHKIQHVDGFPILIVGLSVRNIQGDMIADKYEAKTNPIVVQILDRYAIIAWIIKETQGDDNYVVDYKIVVGDIIEPRCIMSLDYTSYTVPITSQLDVFEHYLFYNMHGGSIYKFEADDLKKYFSMVRCGNTGTIYVKARSRLFKLSDTYALQECCVCFEENQIAALLIDCGHYASCMKCIGNIRNCPICREKISNGSVISLY